MKNAVYIKLNGNRIVEIAGGFTEPVQHAGWLKIDEGEGNRYYHAQSKYLSKPLTDETGCHNYIYENGIREATMEEKAEEYATFEQPVPIEDIIRNLVNEMTAARLNAMEQTISNLTYTIRHLSDNVQEIVKKEDSEMPTGDYLNPIPYVSGMAVEAGKWYTEDGYIWEAIKSGVPTGFFDREYFDVVGV